MFLQSSTGKPEICLNFIWGIFTVYLKGKWWLFTLLVWKRICFNGADNAINKIKLNTINYLYLFRLFAKTRFEDDVTNCQPFYTSYPLPKFHAIQDDRRTGALFVWYEQHFGLFVIFIKLNNIILIL